MGDGGEGTMEALAANLDGVYHTVPVEGPNARTVESTYALSAEGKTAIMEMNKLRDWIMLPNRIVTLARRRQMERGK